MTIARRSWALGAASTAMLLISFNATAVNVAFPALEADFEGESLASLSWVVSGFNIMMTTMMLVGGRLADRVGRKQVFVAGMAVFVVGSGLTALAPTVVLLVLARIVQAAGAAMVLPTSLAAVLPDFPSDRQASVVSLWAGVGVFGATAAPSIAAGIVDVWGWRAIFVALVIVSVGGLAVGHRTMSESRPDDPGGQLDVTGAVIGTVALGSLALGVVQGPRWGWLSPGIVGALVTAGVLGPWFWRRCRVHPEPLLAPRLFAIRTFSVPTVAAAFLAVSTTATWLLYPLFMDTVWGYSTLQIGLAITPGPAVMVLVNLWAGRRADARGYRSLIVWGSVLPCLGTLWLAVFFGPDVGYLVGFLPATLMIGTGMGMSMGPMNSAALREVASSALGEANAAFNTIRSLGSALGVAVAVAVVGDLDRVDISDAFQRALFVALAVMSIAPLLVIVAYPRDRAPDPSSTPTAS